MTYQATQTNATITPRKLRLVAHAIKKLSPQAALDQLTYLNKESARVLKKVFQQAIANAKNNAHANPADLKISQIIINQGRTLNRGRASARGRSKPYQHVYSHVTVKLVTPEKHPGGGRVKRSETSDSRGVSKSATKTKKKVITKKITKK